MKTHLKLKCLRNYYNYKQQQIADFLNVSKSTYTHYEMGDRQPDIEKILKLSEIFHTEPMHLLSDLCPAVVFQACPQNLFDDFHQVINQINITNDYDTNVQICINLMRVHNYYYDIYITPWELAYKAIDADDNSIEWDRIPEGYEPIKYYSDRQVELLFSKSLELQRNLLRKPSDKYLDENYIKIFSYKGYEIYALEKSNFEASGELRYKINHEYFKNNIYFSMSDAIRAINNVS